MTKSYASYVECAFSFYDEAKIYKERSRGASSGIRRYNFVTWAYADA